MAIGRAVKVVDEKEAISILRTKDKLESYLMSKGINSSAHFNCINPDHDDKDPSCCVGGGLKLPIFYCHGCQATGDLFTAVHFLEEDMPIQGPRFWTETLPWIANRFNVEYTPRQLNEDEKAHIQLKKAHFDASCTIRNFVLSDWDKDVEHVNIVKARQITKESVKDFRIGAIPSVEAYVKAMETKGWSRGHLLESGLLDREDKQDKIFVPGKIIITVSDPNGEPIAFVSRKHNWKGKEDGAKYVNSSSSVIYKKAHTLFGFDLAKKHIIGKSKETQRNTLHIVEGYIDVITLRQAGFKNVAGLGAADFHNEVIEHLRDVHRIKISDLTFALDGDETGTANTRKVVDSLSGKVGIKVSVKQLPRQTGYHDPDEIVREHGIKAFKRLEVFTPFKWRINLQKDSEIPEEEFAKEACNIIAKENSPITRIGMIKDLADLTVSFNVYDLTNEVNQIRGDNKANLDAELNMIFEDMIKRKGGARTNVVALLNSTLAKANQAAKDHENRSGNQLKLHNQQIEDAYDLFKKNKKLNGFKLNNFTKLQNALEGFPDKECMIAIAGEPNIGKSSLVRELSWDIAKSNDDAMVIYMTIDDSARDVLQAIVARESKESRKYVKTYAHCGEERQEIIDEAWDKVKNQKNYLICDATFGSTLMHLQDHIDYLKREYPNKRPIIFLDNFHKLQTGEVMNMREKFVEMSQQIKNLSQVNDVPIVMTVELRKREYGKSFRMDDIAETKKIVYDSKIIIYVNQDMHHNPETNVKWPRNNYDAMQVDMPYLEVGIKKNKHSDNKGNFGFKFETDRSILTECEWDEVKQHYENSTQSQVRPYDGR